MGGTKIGIGFGLWGLGLPSPETICDYAERAEDQGIDSIWLSDHIVARNPSFDTACIMAMWAGRTKKIKIIFWFIFSIFFMIIINSLAVIIIEYPCKCLI